MKRRSGHIIARVVVLVGWLLGALGPLPAQARATATVVTNCTQQGLQNALDLGSGAINFSCGPNPVDILIVAVSGMNIPIGQSNSIDGGNLVTLHATNNRLFDVRVNAALTLTNISLRNGYSSLGGNLPGWGGAILAEGKWLMLDHVTVRDSISVVTGGAIHIVAGGALIQNSLIAGNYSETGGGIYSTAPLTLTNTTLNDNHAASGNGGGLDVYTATTILSSWIISNSTVADGGGLAVETGATANMYSTRVENNWTDPTNGSGGGIVVNGTFTAINTRLTGNRAANGGGLQVENGFAELVDSVVSGNQAGERGGGLMAQSADLGLENTTVEANQALFGGGVYSTLSTAALFSARLLGNHANTYGGGLDNNASSLSVLSSTFGDNDTDGYGGAIYNTGSSTVAMDDSTLRGNRAGLGAGAIFNQTGAELMLNTSTLRNNQADSSGGGLYNAGEAALTNMTLSGNTSGGLGGGLYNEGKLTLINDTLSGNAANLGGAIYAQGSGVITMTNTILAYSVTGGNCGLVIDNVANSISSDASCNLPGLVNGFDPNGLDPLLTALGNYGGPTEVHMLKLGSPAIGGGFYQEDFDQRNQPRPGADALFDVGAVERQDDDSDLAPRLWLPLTMR